MPAIPHLPPAAKRTVGFFCASLACALALTTAVRADTVPASIRACIGEADPTQRLACYDREVARLIAPAGTFAPPPAALAPAMPSAPTAAVPPAAAAPALPSPSTSPSPSHLTGTVRTARQSGDTLVVTLEDGAVWVQSAPATGPLNLKPGEVVHLDREMGSWFLSNRYGDNLQVKLRQP
jgi:hypothetical protein